MSLALRWSVSVAFVLVGLTTLAWAAPDDPSKQVDALVHKYVHDDAPGIAVLVIKDGKVVHKKGYGLADLAKKTPITPATNFDLASLSKQFTALAIMILKDKGKLSFDDDVRKHLPTMPVYDSKRPIRIRDLLNHTSGLPVDYPDSATTNDAMLQWLIKTKKLAHPTGAKHLYSNVGYAILALVVKSAGNKSYNTFLQEEVFQHLKMKQTVAFESPKVSRGPHALGYELRESIKPFHEGDTPESVLKRTKAANFQVSKTPASHTVGDGGIWSNLDDLAYWDEAVRKGYLVKPETWKEALTPPRLPNGQKVDYGFGWGLTIEGQKVTELWHEGGYGGYSTLNSIYLQDKLCVVILSNIGDFDYLSAMDDGIWDIYLGQKKNPAFPKPVKLDQREPRTHPEFTFPKQRVGPTLPGLKDGQGAVLQGLAYWKEKKWLQVSCYFPLKDDHPSVVVALDGRIKRVAR